MSLVSLAQVYNRIEDTTTGVVNHDPMHYPARSILIIDVSPFGKSLALLPAVSVVRDAYPTAFIAAAASTGVCELLLNAGLVTETIDLGVIRPHGGGSSFKRTVRLIRNSRRFAYELIVDFAPRPETQFLSRFVLRARTITPSKLPLLLEFLVGGASRSRGEPHTDYDRVLRKLGLRASERRVAFTPTAEENERFEERLSRNGFRGGEPIVVLYTTGGGAWPLASFAETANRLTNNFNARIVVVDEPSDQTFTSALEPLLPRTAIRVSAPHALELIAAVARATVVITDEPYVAGVASGMGTPVIDVAEPPMRPTRGSVHGNKAASVTTDEVFEEACEILQESRSPFLFRQ
ncbi:MAG TPA: hypothetical protein VNS63_12710 [Blastocatellia bacterium]|nr:hypothetical protein [Blastocatellia bacterium]